MVRASERPHAAENGDWRRAGVRGRHDMRAAGACATNPELHPRLLRATRTRDPRTSGDVLNANRTFLRLRHRRIRRRIGRRRVARVARQILRGGRWHQLLRTDRAERVPGLRGPRRNGDRPGPALACGADCFHRSFGAVRSINAHPAVHWRRTGHRQLAVPRERRVHRLRRRPRDRQRTYEATGNCHRADRARAVFASPARGSVPAARFGISTRTASCPSDFAGPKIDLGGWTYNFTVGMRF